MKEKQRRLILANGEKYVAPVEKKGNFVPPELPRTFDEARSLVKSDVELSLQRIAELAANKRLNDDAVLCLRLHPDMIAKSYDPQGIFGLVRDLENVGSRNYSVQTSRVAQTKRVKKLLEKDIQMATGRMLFVRSNDAGFRRLLRLLDSAESNLPSPFKEEIRRIERFDLLDSREQMLGFDQDWIEGRVEVVLHPSQYAEDQQTDFFRQLLHGRDKRKERLNVAFYEGGPMFISCFLTHADLRNLEEANPLRNVHPLVFSGFEELRSSPEFKTPLPSTTSTRSTIKVGMFDGGIDATHPLLQGHAEQDESLSTKCPADPRFVAHGTAVAGALLYGPLNDLDTQEPLPAPAVSLVSIRALPTSNPADIDLYEAIDVIELAVPARKDIKVFNISFGPRGPILDDTISRFTFALDLLAATHKATFCVAVGNDGEAGDQLNKVQSPSDLVNGLGIGACTERKGKKVHAPYSCRGPGRECAKMKPDVVYFGGCDQMPFHLIGVVPGAKVLSAGTSFASPVVAALCGQATESFDRGTALLARALIIHTAEHPDDEPDHLLGHGIVPPKLDSILRCDETEVTIIFQGDIPAKKMVKLPILLPPDTITGGNVEIKWTVAALPTVSPNHPSDYTTMCIEDTFYPHGQMYTFSPPKGSPATVKAVKLHLKNDALEIKRLMAERWRKSQLPVSDSGNQYPSESDKRSQYKWESVVRRAKSKRAASLHEPALVLHAIPRHGVTNRLEYAAVVSIKASKFEGDLYDLIVRRFSALQPIRLRTEAELRVQI